MAARHGHQRSRAQPDRDMLGRADLRPDADCTLKAGVTAIEVTQRLRLRSRTSWAPPSSEWPAAMPNASPRLTASSTSAASIPALLNGSARTGRLEGLEGLEGAGRHVRGHAARHG
jgi:hypothetical protein